MRSHSQIAAVFLTFLVFFFPGCSGGPADPAAPELKRRLVERSALIHTTDTICSRDILRAFYERRSFAPLWSDDQRISALAESLRTLLTMASAEGLAPRDYHVDAFGVLLEKIATAHSEKSGAGASVRAELDLLLSDAFLLYACHLSEGKVARDSLRPRRSVVSHGDRYVTILNESVSGGDVAHKLRALAPSHTYYRALRSLLASYRSQEKNDRWTRVPAGSPMVAGERGKRVFLLRSRLHELGDLHPRIGSLRDDFDSTLVDAVRVFQRRHGLGVSGVADSATVDALNVSPSKRVEQVLVTMERWRWLPPQLGKNHVLVNIPDFRLTAVEDDRVVLSMKVVLGLPTWQTPVFSSAIEQVLFNSPWLAPRDIVEKELINYMKADTNYLPSNMMSLWKRVGDSLVRIEHRSINWPEMTPEKIDFYLRQEGGPQNIMGQVKFLTPNSFSVYLHDTPYRDDFVKDVRMFSHGCIRLEKPFEFAELVLKKSPEWTRARIDTVIARRAEHTIRLKTVLPVHIVYATVWRDQDGSVQFRPDYYGLDRKLAAALLRAPIDRPSAPEGSISAR